MEWSVNRSGLKRMGAVKKASMRAICTTGRMSRKKVNSAAQTMPRPRPRRDQGMAERGKTRQWIVHWVLRTAKTANTTRKEKPNSALATIHRVRGRAKGETGSFFSSQSPCTMESMQVVTTFSKYRQGTRALKRKTA